MERVPSNYCGGIQEIITKIAENKKITPEEMTRVTLHQAWCKECFKKLTETLERYSKKTE